MIAEANMHLRRSPETVQCIHLSAPRGEKKGEGEISRRSHLHRVYLDRSCKF